MTFGFTFGFKWDTNQVPLNEGRFCVCEILAKIDFIGTYIQTKGYIFHLHERLKGKTSIFHDMGITPGWHHTL